MLKEKILQQVGPRSGAGTSSAAAAPRKSRLFPSRPLLTLDFLPPTAAAASDERIGPLGAIPVSSQESAVIDDLVGDRGCELALPLGSLATIDLTL